MTLMLSRTRMMRGCQILSDSVCPLQIISAIQTYNKLFSLLACLLRMNECVTVNQGKMVRMLKFKRKQDCCVAVSCLYTSNVKSFIPLPSFFHDFKGGFKVKYRNISLYFNLNPFSVVHMFNNAIFMMFSCVKTYIWSFSATVSNVSENFLESNKSICFETNVLYNM